MDPGGSTGQPCVNRWSGRRGRKLAIRAAAALFGERATGWPDASGGSDAPGRLEAEPIADELTPRSGPHGSAG